MKLRWLCIGHHNDTITSACDVIPIIQIAKVLNGRRVSLLPSQSRKSMFSIVFESLAFQRRLEATRFYGKIQFETVVLGANALAFMDIRQNLHFNQISDSILHSTYTIEYKVGKSNCCCCRFIKIVLFPQRTTSEATID